MSVQDPGLFWYKAKLRLRSALTPQQVHEQLSKALPRFDVQTGRQSPDLGLFAGRGRVFNLSVGEGTFRVSRPLCGPRGRISLIANGRVEPDEQGSLIHLTAENGGVVYLVFIGIVLIVLLGCAVALDFYPVMIGAVPLCLLGIIQYLLGTGRSRKALKPLVLCLEKMLRAQRTL